MSELDRIAELAVQNERERIYGLLLMHPWRGPDADEETAIDRAIKADRFGKCSEWLQITPELHRL